MSSSLYRLCEKFGWTPQQVRDMGSDDIETFLAFMGAEHRAADLRAKRQKHYGS